jgi:hypothetical protein
LEDSEGHRWVTLNWTLEKWVVWMADVWKWPRIVSSDELSHYHCLRFGSLLCPVSLFQLHSLIASRPMKICRLGLGMNLYEVALACLKHYSYSLTQMPLNYRKVSLHLVRDLKLTPSESSSERYCYISLILSYSAAMSPFHRLYRVRQGNLTF